MTLVLLAAAFFIVLALYLITVAANNHRKQQFFWKNAPGLKVLENPNLFTGHTLQLGYAKHNVTVVDEFMRKHGPTVGCYYRDKPIVYTTDLDFIKTFAVDEQTHIERFELGLPIKEIEEDCIMTAKGDQWLRLRRAIAPAFSAHKIKLPNVQSDINCTIGKVVHFIEQRLDQAERERHEDFIEQDAEDICHRYALDLVFTNFYKQPNVVDFNSDHDKWVEMIEKSMRKLVGPFAKASAVFPWLRHPLNWLVLHFDDQGVMRRKVMDYIKLQTKNNFEATKEVERGEKQSNDADNFTLKDGSRFRRNMVDYVTDQYREGKLTRSEYFNSTFFLFFAADKTSADALSLLLYNLARHPEIQEKLRESILASGVDSEYLSWVIHESVRLWPPVPLGCSRTITRDIQTKHGIVPAGTFVITPVYTIGRLKEYWGEDADEFRPERWSNSKSFHPVQFLVFGAGRRTCPGRELALMEIKMLLNVLVRRYRFERSKVHRSDDSRPVSSPIFTILVFDTPTYVRISRLASSTQ